MDTHGHAIDAEEGIDYFKKYLRPWLKENVPEGQQPAKNKRTGLYFTEAKKSDLGTVRDVIGELLLPDKINGALTPRMKVFEACLETISEFENVRYPQGDVERPAQERPMTYRKHMLDATHYIFADRAGFLLPQRPQQDTFKAISEACGY